MRHHMDGTSLSLTSAHTLINAHQVRPNCAYAASSLYARSNSTQSSASLPTYSSAWYVATFPPAPYRPRLKCLRPLRGYRTRLPYRVGLMEGVNVRGCVHAEVESGEGPVANSCGELIALIVQARGRSAGTCTHCTRLKGLREHHSIKRHDMKYTENTQNNDTNASGFTNAMVKRHWMNSGSPTGLGVGGRSV